MDYNEGNSFDIVRHLLESAEAQLRSAKQIIAEMEGNTSMKLRKPNLSAKAAGLTIMSEGKVIEGIFDGEMMIGPDGKKYPVPANYASKSKFVPGVVLKLTIEDDGNFVYKQIKQIERRRLVGSLLYEDGKYKILAGGKTYNVLLASVTYYKTKPGDTVTVAVPAHEDAEWAAIESAAIDND